MEKGSTSLKKWFDCKSICLGKCSATLATIITPLGLISQKGHSYPDFVEGTGSASSENIWGLGSNHYKLTAAGQDPVFIYLFFSPLCFGWPIQGESWRMYHLPPLFEKRVIVSGFSPFAWLKSTGSIWDRKPTVLRLLLLISFIVACWKSWPTLWLQGNGCRLNSSTYHINFVFLERVRQKKINYD